MHNHIENINGVLHCGFYVINHSVNRDTSKQIKNVILKHKSHDDVRHPTLCNCRNSVNVSVNMFRYFHYTVIHRAQTEYTRGCTQMQQDYRLVALPYWMLGKPQNVKYHKHGAMRNILFIR
jgi:hypothetical protein